MASNTFIGFSTNLRLGNVYDINIVNQDLLNQINTRKGSKVMDPEFGSIIFDLLFELKSASTKSDIQADLTRIINSDPRVQLRKIQINEVDYGYIGEVLLYYNKLATTSKLLVHFNESTGLATAR